MVGAEGSLLVRSSAHLEHALHQLHIMPPTKTNTAMRTKHIIKGVLLCDVDFIAERLDGGCVVLPGLVPQKALNGHV